MRKIIFYAILISLIITFMVTGCASSDVPTEQVPQAQAEQTAVVSPHNEPQVDDQTLIPEELPAEAYRNEDTELVRDAYEATQFLHDTSDDDIIDIDDYNFADSVMNILFINTHQLLGRTIRYEGILLSYYWDFANRYIHNVVRYTDATGSGDYASIGLEIFYDGEMLISAGAWVEVVGVLERPDPGEGYMHVRLRVTSLVELDERGTEIVRFPVLEAGG